MKIDSNILLKNNIHENSLTKIMKTEIQQLQSLVTIVIKMIKNDYPDTTSVCSQDSMNLGEFKTKIKLTKKDIELIKRNEPITNELIKLDFCERAIK
ncbi:hypothetical protein [uncultured Mediterranean phage uvMED]|nr:hypothetical protein [uncultured Mediterranean phage uvMED]BAR21037.1 hypothetical protein [uncultured Mediterranean phage uvMED]